MNTQLCSDDDDFVQISNFVYLISVSNNVENKCFIIHLPTRNWYMGNYS